MEQFLEAKAYNTSLNKILQEMIKRYEKVKILNSREDDIKIQKLNIILGFIFLNPTISISSIENSIVSFSMEKENEDAKIYQANLYEVIHHNLKFLMKTLHYHAFVNFEKDIWDIVDRSLELTLSEDPQKLLAKENMENTNVDVYKLWGTKDLD